jgi:hypothetical protein
MAISDMTFGAFWLITNFSLFFSCINNPFVCIKNKSLCEIFVYALVTFYGIIVFSSTLLGSAHLLTSFNLVSLVFIISLSFISYKYFVLKNHLFFFRNKIHFNTKFFIILFIFIFFISHVLINGIFDFPTDWDSLAYHLPLVNHWLQNHSLQSTDGGRWTSPGNNELLALWFVCSFSGDFFASFNNILPSILLGSSILLFCNLIGLTKFFSFLTFFISTVNTVCFKQIANQENDVAVLALFVSSLSFLIIFYRLQCRVSLLYFGISTGILLGIKFYAIGYCFSLYFILLLVFIKLKKPCKIYYFLSLFLFLLFGGYWYIRNFIITGSPIYPKGFLNSPDIISIMYPSVGQSSFFGNLNPDLPLLYLKSVLIIMGPYFAIPVFVFPVFILIYICRLKTSVIIGFLNLNFSCADVLIFLCISCFLLLGLTPFAVEDSPGTLNQMHWFYCPVRYGLCFLFVLSAYCSFVLNSFFIFIVNRQIFIRSIIHYFRSVYYFYPKIFIFGFICFFYIYVACFFSDFINDFHLVMVLSLNIYLSVINLSFFYCHSIKSVFIYLLIFTSFFSMFCALVSFNWHQKFLAFYDNHLFENSKILMSIPIENQTNICVLDYRCYPFFGSSRKNRVFQPVYINSTKYFHHYLCDNCINFIFVRLDSDKNGWKNYILFEDYFTENQGKFHKVASFNDKVYFNYTNSE